MVVSLENTNQITLCFMYYIIEAPTNDLNKRRTSLLKLTSQNLHFLHVQGI